MYVCLFGEDTQKKKKTLNMLTALYVFLFFPPPWVLWLYLSAWIKTTKEKKFDFFFNAERLARKLA